MFKILVAGAAHATVLALAPYQASSKSVVIVAARMLDVSSGRYVEDPLIVIEGGRIVSVSAGKVAVASVPLNAERINLPGMTLLPGLIDMHVHLTSTPLINGYDRLRVTDAFWPTLGVPNAKSLLDAGFTTVRSMGAPQYADVAVRQGIERGFYPGPRVVAAASTIGPTGGHCDTNNLPPSLRSETGDAGENGVEEVRLRVRQNRRYGADVIKLCATGGVFSSNTEPGAQQMSEEELRAGVEAAHMLGMRVAAHAHGTEGIKAAVRAGVDTIEHASFLDDEAIRLARERKTWLSMDIYNTEYTLSEGERNGVEPENLEKERQVGTRQRESFRRSVRAGVRHVFGTDAGVYPHGTGARQFRVMVEYGMTPLQAIQSATANAAAALNRSNDVGTLAVGRFGDMIAVAGDPLRNVRLLEAVPVVIKGGQVIVDRREPRPSGN